VILLADTDRPEGMGRLGLDTLGIEPGSRGIVVDERCRTGDGVWAIGDVTGVKPFTHVGMYQGRIAAADITGQDARADYTAIPRVVFSDPEIAAVGLTSARAAERGIDLATAEIELPEAIARPRPSNVNRAARSGCSLTATVACLSEPGRSPRWPVNGSTTPRSRSRHRS